MSSEWQYRLRKTYLSLHTLFLSTMSLNVLLFFFLPHSEPLGLSDYGWLLLATLLLSALTFPITSLLRSFLMSPKRLKIVSRHSGMKAATLVLKTSCLLIGCVGDLPGVFAAALFAYSRSPYLLLMILPIWAVQYRRTMRTFQRGRLAIHCLKPLKAGGSTRKAA